MENIQKNKSISIAVLPFQVSGDDIRIENLFLGFTEDLITNFSKFIGLSVISSYSTQQIKDTANEFEIEQLGADYLIFGSVRYHNTALRISIQLVKADDKSVIYANQYNETLDSLLETQDDIVQHIVSLLQEKIDYNLLSYSYKKNAVDLHAYENYLLGMNILKQGTAKSDIEARAYFNKAIEIDSNFSLAYTGLSLSYFNFWSCLLWDRWEISQKGAHEFALRAIESDPNDYIALGVLGRTYVYLGEFEKAEHFLRKSLRMNANDAGHLLRVAFSLMFLGYANEAVALYEKATKLNPLHTDHYYAHGAIYYLEIGDFKKSIELSKKVDYDAWTDFPAFIAASYLQLKDYENVRRCWKIYLEQFKTFVYSGKKPLEEEALDWLIIVNPYKGKNYLYQMVDFLRSEKNLHNASSSNIVATSPEASFILNGNFWTISYKGSVANVKDAKGFHDIYKFLNEPNKEFHCLDLMGSGIDESNNSESIDQKAKLQYHNRIKELQQEIEEAEAMNNTHSITALREEYDSILEYLSNAIGLSGKARKVGSTIEKARSAVTWRIRSSIKKIDALHPELGKHLSKSIKTGTYCMYQPEYDINWSL
ncbi:tetratricopeptide repeat protein [Winogradskyella sp.]|uniref:tetratricopeptide repeat protein n=1 Tax=Winogradskyella sp. TaxID=1883156 RepID=UPI003BAB2D29